MKTWRIDTNNQTLVFSSLDDRLPSVIYWGVKLPKNESLNDLSEATKKDWGDNLLDKVPTLSILPEQSANFSGQLGCKIRDTHGKILSSIFVFSKDKATSNSLILTYVDKKLDLTYTASISAFDDVYVLSAKLDSKKPIFMEWFSAPVIAVSQNSCEMVDYSGQWIGEFRSQITPWVTGAHLRESRVGTTSHANFPGLLIPSIGSAENSGSCYGFHYGWSGGHRMIAEQLQDGRRQIQFGNTENSENKSGTSFETAELYICHSNNGVGGVGQCFRDHVANSIVDLSKDSIRPVHYNCWEAVYFDHSIDELKEIASLASEIGAERFVLDDGWFKARNSAKSSLGDWVVDKKKYPKGLKPLINHIHSVGMTFGLWFEPEMVSPDSDLYRLHPEWIMGHKDQTLGREQFALDISLKEVQEYLFNSINSLLKEYPIEYIKWDHNRVLPYPDSAQTISLYKLLSRIRNAHPSIEIESCSSGGGRIDYGILRNTQRVWLSDSNDALERLRIQHEALLWLPSSVTGSHVGPKVCHTSGRKLSMSFRAWVAAQRHMGFEMDPRELSSVDKTLLKAVTSWWKKNRHWMKDAIIFRLPCIDKSITAEIQIDSNSKRFVIFAGQNTSSEFSSPVPLVLAGLDPLSMYNIVLHNKDEINSLGKTKEGLLSKNLKLSGHFLMSHGLQLPKAFPANMIVIEGDKAA
ncbi:MAG: alpha-galactosidase [Candidatus Thioglobus sp.]|nr:alpha-galactosidase [Candidatus Thioglobus sp.]|tara:strand:- start:5058 stop:7133 length:2076 start_codon:yes stop_codon:yes gene_type:complete